MGETVEKKYWNKEIELSKIKEIRNKLRELWGKASIEYERYEIGEIGGETNKSREYSSFDSFWKACHDKKAADVNISIQAGFSMERSFSISSLSTLPSLFSSELTVSIESPEHEEIDELFRFVEETLGLEEMPNVDNLISISLNKRFQGIDNYDYNSIIEIREFLKEKWRLPKFFTETYKVDWGNEVWDYPNHEKFRAAIDKRSQGIKSIEIYCTSSHSEQSLRLSLSKSGVSIDVSDYTEEGVKETAKYIEEKLKLKKGRPPLTESSAFIAYPSGPKGKELKGIIQECLMALGFNVVSEESASLHPVSEKIKEQIRKQAVFVVIHSKPETTPAEDISQWLLEGTTFAISEGKPVVRFVEEGVVLKHPVSGDLEEIRFSEKDIVGAIIKLVAAMKYRFSF